LEGPPADAGPVVGRRRGDGEATAVFLGEHQHIVDAKGRVVMPSRFRAQLADGLVTTRGFDRCLYVFRMEDFRREAVEVLPRDRTDLGKRNRARSLFGGASDLPLDAQGRLPIPLPLREYARLTRDVIVLGIYDHIEIWDAETWSRKQAELDEQYANTDTGPAEEER
jgi:MraZ protein